ncbi:MAG: PH domain-containing protein [Candidatus Binatia bacterium]
MSYVDRHLGPGERVEFRTRLHPVLFTGTVGFGLAVAAAVVLVVQRNELGLEAVLRLVGGGIAATALSVVGPYVRWRTSEFAVTDRRVLVKLGFLSVRTVDLLVGKVEAVSVDQTPLGRLLGFGTVQITGTGGTIEAFSHVARPFGFRDAVLRHAPSSAVRAG